MEHPIDIVKRFYHLLGEKDIPGIAGLFADEIDWYSPAEQPHFPWLKRRSRNGEMLSFFKLVLGNIESIQFTIQHSAADENFAVVAGSFTLKMRGTSEPCQSIFTAHFGITGGRINFYSFWEDSLALTKAAGRVGKKSLYFNNALTAVL